MAPAAMNEMWDSQDQIGDDVNGRKTTGVIKITFNFTAQEVKQVQQTIPLKDN